LKRTFGAGRPGGAAGWVGCDAAFSVFILRFFVNFCDPVLTVLFPANRILKTSNQLRKGIAAKKPEQVERSWRWNGGCGLLPGPLKV